jgi:ribosome-associated protein YbcJ (S4-like RNA binding protein)
MVDWKEEGGAGKWRLERGQILDNGYWILRKSFFFNFFFLELISFF